MNSRHLTRAGYVILAVAFLIRVVSTHFHPLAARLYSDMANYAVIANDLRNGVWLPQHFFQPVGFPYIISLFMRAFTDWTRAFALYQAIIGTAALWFMWDASVKSFGPRVGLAALVIGAFHVQWLAYNLFALSENTFTFLLSALLWVSVKTVQRESYVWAALWGLVFAAGLWVKGTHVFLGPLFLLGILAWKRPLRPAVTRLVVPISVVVATGLILHGALAYRTIGLFQMSASAGGLNFVDGKCPVKVNIDSAGQMWGSPLYYQLDMSTQRKVWDRPFIDSAYFMREGFRCIQNDPFVLVQSLENIPFLFIGNFSWPANQLRVAPFIRLYELFLSIFLVTGLLVWLRSCWPVPAAGYTQLLVWLAPILALFICVYVFKSEIRFRIPFDVYFIPVAVQGWRIILLNLGPGPAPLLTRGQASAALP